MTKKEAIKKHRKMWNWLAANPESSKKDYLEQFDADIELQQDCYLCTYASNNCNKCPLQWPGGNCVDYMDKGLYSSWKRSIINGQFEFAAEVAKRIAELPEK